MKAMNFHFHQSAGLLALVAALSLSACAPLVVGGAAAGVMAANDRRTSGTLVEDNALEFKISNAIAKATGDKGHVSVTSFNRRVLLTGEMPSAALKAIAEETAKRADNVVLVVNELAVSGSASATQRASDTLLSSRVKVALIGDKRIDASAVKVVTDRGQVYLMGLLTEPEATRATDVVRRVSGVQGVVRVIELISEQDLLRLKPPVKTVDTKTPAN
jgi:osmotically-inducible protein OsmY